MKRRCARISNMEITKVKGGRRAKYRYRESMSEKAPEVAERSSKRNCLRMGRSSEKLARRPGAEMMWPSCGGSRACKHKGSNPGTVAMSGEARTTCVRRACTRKEICCLPTGVQARRVPGWTPTGQKKNFIQPIGDPRVGRQSPIELAGLRQSPIEQAFHGRDAHECVQHPGDTAHSWCERKTLKTVPYRFNAVEAQAG